MPSHEEAIEKATLLMRSFAERTGLTSDRPKQRYLWTDAFAVCNLLGLARLTGERSYADLALRLVEQVHHVLGRYRADGGPEPDDVHQRHTARRRRQRALRDCTVVRSL